MGQTSPEESEALLTIIDSMHNLPPMWSYQGIASACNWKGITCDLSGHITQLILSGQVIDGTIPWQISNFAYLQKLDLSTNALSGTVPEELGVPLANLQLLDLHNNHLSGSIPFSLKGLQQLQILDLGYNLLTGTIPPELGMLSNKNVKQILLPNNLLSGTVPGTIANLTSLWRLTLSGNKNLTGCIPSSLGRLLLSSCTVQNTNVTCCGNKVTCVSDFGYCWITNQTRMNNVVILVIFICILIISLLGVGFFYLKRRRGLMMFFGTSAESKPILSPQNKNQGGMYTQI